jgi:formate-dependent nitrite reductase cytochrome c552 subunit
MFEESLPFRFARSHRDEHNARPVRYAIQLWANQLFVKIETAIGCLDGGNLNEMTVQTGAPTADERPLRDEQKNAIDRRIHNYIRFQQSIWVSRQCDAPGPAHSAAGQ